MVCLSGFRGLGVGVFLGVCGIIFSEPCGVAVPGFCLVIPHVCMALMVLPLMLVCTVKPPVMSHMVIVGQGFPDCTDAWPSWPK